MAKINIKSAQTLLTDENLIVFLNKQKRVLIMSLNTPDGVLLADEEVDSIYNYHTISEHLDCLQLRDSSVKIIYYKDYIEISTLIPLCKIKLNKEDLTKVYQYSKYLEKVRKTEKELDGGTFEDDTK